MNSSQYYKVEILRPSKRQVRMSNKATSYMIKEYYKRICFLLEKEKYLYPHTLKRMIEYHDELLQYLNSRKYLLHRLKMKQI